MLLLEHGLISVDRTGRITDECFRGVVLQSNRDRPQIVCIKENDIVAMKNPRCIYYVNAMKIKTLVCHENFSVFLQDDMVCTKE